MKKVKLITGMITKEKELFEEIQRELAKKFGKIDFESEILPFTHTDYYYEEFGKPLFRKFIAFEKLIKPDSIATIKIFTNKLEQKYSIDNKRRINLDPGYIALAKLVLASTKDYSHRIYLKNNVYAEVTLFYKDKTFQSFPYTYPDYKTKEYIEIFNKIREILKQQSRKINHRVHGEYRTHNCFAKQNRLAPFSDTLCSLWFI